MQLKLSLQPRATDCFLILFLWVYRRWGLSSSDLSFIKQSPPTVAQSFISSPPLMWNIFGYSHTLNFVIVKSALHSLWEDVKIGHWCVFLGAFLDGGLMSCWPHIELSNISQSVIFSLLSVFGRDAVPPCARLDTAWWENKHVFSLSLSLVFFFFRKSNFLVSHCKFTRCNGQRENPASWMFLS